MNSSFTLKDLAELEHYENLKEVNLRWLNDPVKEILPILKRCTHLRRLTLATFVPGTILPAGIGYRTAVKLQLTCHVGENVPALSVSMNKFSVARLAIVDLRSGPLAGLPWRIFQLI